MQNDERKETEWIGVARGNRPMCKNGVKDAAHVNLRNVLREEDNESEGLDNGVNE